MAAMAHGADEAATPRMRNRPATHVSEMDLEAAVSDILGRRPAIGLAVAVVIDGRREFFYGHGLANLANGTHIAKDTIFRVGSVTKLFTTMAILQLVEHDLVDLDAPANDYLRGYRLMEGAFRSATVRHLLTHTSGVPDMRHLSDLLHAGLTPDDGRPPLLSVPFGCALPTLAEYYRDGLRVVDEPGTGFAYSNHGFATLGQIVEDVTGQPLDGYMREHVFQPLGMVDLGPQFPCPVSDGPLAWMG